MLLKITSKTGLRAKMIQANLLLLVVMWGILIISTVVTISSNIGQQTQFFLHNNVQMACDQLRDLVGVMKNCSNSVMLSLNQEPTLKDDPAGKNALKRYNAVTMQMSFVNHVYRSVESMLFVDGAGQVYTTGVPIEAYLDEAFLTEHNAALDAASEQSVFFGMIKPESGALMLMGKRVINIQDGNILGYLYLAVSETRLAGMLDEFRYTDHSALILCSDQGTVLSAADKTQIGQPLAGEAGDFWNWNGAAPLVGYRQRLLELGFELVYTVPARELYAETFVLVLALLGLGVLGAVLSVLVARYFSNKLTRPILQLTEDMRQVEQGNLELRSSVQTDDEVGVLARGFNQMLNKVHELLEAVTREQGEKAQKEIALLQNQIKPHFLYNTLNTIYILCLMGEGEKAAGATKSLADYYRYNLSGGRNVLSIQEELACVEKYLDIQRLVYQERLSVGIVCNPEAASCQLPKMTIQPIVENAVVHGLKPQNGGSVLVQVSEETGRAVIRVTDDGVGMDEERRKGLLERKSLSGFGLKNVGERLALYFGEAASISIASAPGGGTTVTITLPARPSAEREEHENADPACGR